jgi:DNA-directed RNA polymerase subunit K/omega
VADRTNVPNAFEFVIVAGARAKQLLRGCTPRTTGSDKVITLAQKEVREGKVEKVELQISDLRQQILSDFKSEISDSRI